jgi:dephospho-CoA kinase
LFERNIVDEFDAIVLVDALRPLRLERLVATRGMEATEAMNMIASQMPAELKRARADYVIENNDSLQDLERDVNALWSSLQRDAQRANPLAGKARDPYVETQSEAQVS